MRKEERSCSDSQKKQREGLEFIEKLHERLRNLLVKSLADKPAHARCGLWLW
jgi:hypothetical protein